MSSKTWLITGTSTGLGRLMTERLLARGDKVIATLRKSGALDDLQAQYNGRLHILLLDVTDTDAVRRTVQQAFDFAGRIDVLVSNAGYGLFGAAEEVSDAQIDRQIAWPNFSLYHATKWGIEGFIESVAQEVAPFGIDFMIAEPGPTATNFAGGLDIASPMACYDNTPAGEVRRGLAQGTIAINGDALKTVAAIIDAADGEAPPFRLALGSKAYHSINEALNSRLQVLEDTRALALSVDKDA